jgi:hypothetical protein
VLAAVVLANADTSFAGLDAAGAVGFAQDVAASDPSVQDVIARVRTPTPTPRIPTPTTPRSTVTDTPRPSATITPTPSLSRTPTRTPTPASACSNAIPIPASGGVFFGTTSGVSTLLEPGCVDEETGPERVYRWTPNDSGPWIIETCGSGTNFDTVLHLRRGSCTNQGAEVDCDDDSCAIDTSSRQGS